MGILDQARTCSDLCQWSSKVRRTFYNSNLYSPCAPAAAPRSKVRTLVRLGLNIPIALGGLALVFYFLPSLVFNYLPLFQRGQVLGEQVQADGAVGLAELTEAEFKTQTLIQPNLEQNYGGEKIQPTYDLSAPEGRWLRIGAAEIEAEILTNNDLNDTKTVDELMGRGVYLYPDYSEIGRIGRTVVLASHHYNMWVGAASSQRTFQNLAQVQVGDRIEVVDDYKVWTYEIYKVEEAEAISETTADLIAYTCVYWWDSKLRFFVYARLVTAS